MGQAVSQRTWVVLSRFSNKVATVADGCSDLGVYYWRGGGGLLKDVARAGALFLKACDGGSAVGCKNLDALRASR